MQSTFPRYPIIKPFGTPFIHSEFENTNNSLNYLTPSDIKTFYRFPENLTGKNITVAFVCAFSNGYMQNDLDVFSETFGLPSTTIETYFIGGKSDGFSRAWALEANLDSQWIHALCPDAKIIAVFSPDAKIDSLLNAAKFASDMGVDIVNMSFGVPEHIGQSEKADFLRNSRSVFVSASGDMGGNVFFPSSKSEVLCVGGSVFTKNGANFSREYAWENGGGGVSRFVQIPSYQRLFSPINSLTKGYRGLPDVAFYSSNQKGVAVYTSNPNIAQNAGFSGVGGTSFSSCAFSSICALILEENPDSLWARQINQYFYALAGQTQYNFPQYYFNDITLGSNGEFFAERGWDFCTGLGSPKVSMLTKG